MRLFLCLFGTLALAQSPVFLVPVGRIDTNRAEVSGEVNVFRKEPAEKYLPWLKTDASQRALRLYAQAHRILEERGNAQKQPREYYIALVPGGNHAAVGFKVQTENGVEDHARHAYILLDPDPQPFESTILHETGHVAMEMLAGGRQLPRADICSIPHSTAALTDRATAFSEGYAIHLETLAAHMGMDAKERARYHHESARFGEGTFRDLEFFRHSADLATYSQSLARYLEVRENNYALQPAFRGPDYLRVQLEKARDFAELRDANQLLQSEGFYASFFFLFLMRGAARPDEAEIDTRQEKMLRAMAATFDAVKMEEDTPWLPRLVMEYMKLFPEDRVAVVDATNDLSHGVFVDREAVSKWRKHYLGALRLDRKGMAVEEMMAARKQWREQVLAKPELLLSNLGPQLRCEVKAVQVKIEAFGEASPLLFDANTAPEGILRVVPGLTDSQVQGWVKGRPFLNLEGLRRVASATACRD